MNLGLKLKKQETIFKEINREEYTISNMLDHKICVMRKSKFKGEGGLEEILCFESDGILNVSSDGKMDKINDDILGSQIIIVGNKYRNSARENEGELDRDIKNKLYELSGLAFRDGEIAVAHVCLKNVFENKMLYFQ